MLIPAIDLQGGRIVQLAQGERLAIVSADFDGWIERFKPFDKVQVIDLDAAKGDGDNTALVEMICARLPCRVGGGIRTAARAATLLARGAKKVILGSALFSNGRVDVSLAKELRDMLGEDRLIAAGDAPGGRGPVHRRRNAPQV